MGSAWGFAAAKAPLFGLNAGDFDRIVGRIELAGNLHLFADVLFGLLGDVEEVALRLALGAVAHDEGELAVLELDHGSGEAVRHFLRVRGGRVVLGLGLGVQRRRRQTQGYGECEGCEPGEQSAFLERQNIFPFPF